MECMVKKPKAISLFQKHMHRGEIIMVYIDCIPIELSTIFCGL